MAKRKMVKEQVGVLDLHDLLDGHSASEVAAKVLEEEQAVLDRLVAKGYLVDRVFFDVSYYGYDGGMDVFVMVDREETDKEMAQRVKKEKAERARKKKAQEAKEAREREQYEKLKAKFGG